MESSSKKTYGVNNLMEWQCGIPCGKAIVRVHFIGGAMTGYGMSPAKYTTENPVIQKAIELSPYWRSGKIFLISETEGSGRFLVEGNTVDAPASDKKAVEGNTVDAPASDKKAVEVNSLAEAKDYLVENHGIAASKLLSRAQIMEQANICGVEFNGI